MLDVKSYEQYLREVEFIKSFLYKGGKTFYSRNTSVKRMAYFLDLLGNPQKNINFVLVGGTSGKGSVSNFIYQALLANGVKCGLHTKPYLTSPVEEVSVNGKFISAEEYIRLSRKIKSVMSKAASSKFGIPAYMDVLTAMAILAFKEKSVKWAVVEVGLGGRFDRTNVLQARLAVVTSVSKDHVANIGPRLQDIAWHKAGIIKRGEKAAVLGKIPPAVKRIFIDEAKKSRVPVTWIDTKTQHGFYDSNRRIALSAVELLKSSLLPQIDLRKAEKAMLKTKIAGRLEFAGSDKTTILDAAHNPEKAEWLAESLRHAGVRKVNLVFGALQSHDYGKMISALAPITNKAYLTQPIVENRAAADISKIAGGFEKRGIKTFQALDPMDAYDMAKKGKLPVLVTGSLFLVGNVRSIWWPETRILNERKNI